MKKSKNQSTLTEFKETFTSNVLNHLTSNYQIDKDKLDSIHKTFKCALNEDTEYVLHYSPEHWTHFIAEAAGLNKC